MDIDTIHVSHTQAPEAQAADTRSADTLSADTHDSRGAKKAGISSRCRPLRKGATPPEVGARTMARVHRIPHEGLASVILPGGIHALLSRKHYSWVETKVDLSKRLKVGQTLEVVVRKLETNASGRTWVKVSHRMARPNPWETIDQEHPAGDRTMGQVKELSSTGVWVELETGYPAFVPNQELSYSRRRLRAEDRPEIGAWMELVIQSTDAAEQRIVASHRAVMGNPWETIDQSHPAGSRMWGEVEGIVNAGIFVKLESGLSALVPWAEASWVLCESQPRAQFEIGDRIEVAIQSTDKEKQRIRASHRQAIANPWDAFAARNPSGSVLTGTVHQVVNFGVFVRLEGRFVGLLHKSNLRPGAALCVGDSARVRITDCTPEAGRISLAEVASEATDFTRETCEAPRTTKQAA